MRFRLILLLIFGSSVLFSQEKADSLLQESIAALVYLDSVTITPEEDSFDIESFISLVLQDSSFYLAFRNLREQSHGYEHQIKYFDNEGTETASYHGVHTHTMDNDQCQTMTRVKSEYDGNYLKFGKEYKFYTSKLIDRVFYVHGKNCVDTTKSSSSKKPESKMEQRIADLKTVIFNPGKEVNFPIIGKKMSIFSKRMRKFYDYEIWKENISGNEVYVFNVELKDKYIPKDNKAIIQKMTTYFDKSDYQVLKRDYIMDIHTWLYALHIEVNVALTKETFGYIPANVRYDGFWDIIARKPEICSFEFLFSSDK